ncbi:MAG: hypothetical protein ACYDA1_05685 [Vulcanimicrobiaceae bacterium]
MQWIPTSLTSALFTHVFLVVLFLIQAFRLKSANPKLQRLLVTTKVETVAFAALLLVTASHRIREGPHGIPMLYATIFAALVTMILLILSQRAISRSSA